MKTLHLCIHFGFGDYIICYGLIKELAKQYDEIILFAIPHRSPLHIENIKRLYLNIDNVVITTDDPKQYPETVYIGYSELDNAIKSGYNKPFPEFFYRQAGVPLNLLWDNFVFDRNIEREKAIFYDILKLTDDTVFDFIHDDPHRNFIIKQKYIDKNVQNIRLMDYESISILDILYTVERSRRLHTFTTGLVPFIDQMNILHNDLNLHRYIRPNAFDQPILNLKWNIING